MSHCPACLDQQRYTHRQKYYMSPNNEYFTIETTVQSPCYKEMHRRYKYKIKSKTKKHQKSQKSLQQSRLTYRSQHKKRSPGQHKDSNYFSKNDKDEIKILRNRLSSFEKQLSSLRQNDNELKNQITEMRSRSQTRTPFYPMQRVREQTSIGQMIRQKLLTLRSGKLSLGSEKPTAQDMDQMLIPSSQQQSHQSITEQSGSQQTEYDDQYLHPTHKFTQLMLKLQKPHNQSQQRMIRNEALRVAGKIRQSKPQTQRLYQGLYYC